MTGVAAGGLTLSLSGLDITLLVIYFTFVIGIGIALRRLIKTSTDFFLSGRSLPAWITGIAFISAVTTPDLKPTTRPAKSAGVRIPEPVRVTNP